jgi:hypothetical protein
MSSHAAAHFHDGHQVNAYFSVTQSSQSNTHTQLFNAASPNQVIKFNAYA